MIIRRIFNNNVALAVDERGDESVVIGRGLCFNRRAGDPVDPDAVEKTFALVGNEASDRFERLVNSIDPEYVIVAEDIVEMLREQPGMEVGDGILIELADHIGLAIDRERRGTTLANPLLDEIRLFYPSEYELAQRAARIIHERLDVWVSDEETGFITLHIVNATLNQRKDRVIVSIEMVRDILRIAGEFFGDALDPKSVSYGRFIRHLQFFVQRVLDGPGGQSDEKTPALFERENYPVAFACTDEIVAYVEGARDVRVTDAEKSYLIYHLANLGGNARRSGSREV